MFINKSALADFDDEGGVKMPIEYEVQPHYLTGSGCLLYGVGNKVTPVSHKLPNNLQQSISNYVCLLKTHFGEYVPDNVSVWRIHGIYNGRAPYTLIQSVGEGVINFISAVLLDKKGREIGWLSPKQPPSHLFIQSELHAGTLKPSDDDKPQPPKYDCSNLPFENGENGKDAGISAITYWYSKRDIAAPEKPDYHSGFSFDPSVVLNLFNPTTARVEEAAKKYLALHRHLQQNWGGFFAAAAIIQQAFQLRYAVASTRKIPLAMEEKEYYGELVKISKKRNVRVLNSGMDQLLAVADQMIGRAREILDKLPPIPEAAKGLEAYIIEG